MKCPNCGHEIKRTPKKKKQFSDDSLQMVIAKYIFKKITDLNPGHKPPNWQTWCGDVDSILRLDKRDSNELREVIDWIYNDSFWRTNILCPAKLRQKYDQLNAKRLAQKQSKGGLFDDPPH